MKKLLMISLLMILTGCTANINIKLNDSNLENIISLTEEADKVEALDIDMNHVEENKTLQIFADDLTIFENNANIKRNFIDEDGEYGFRYIQNLPYEEMESKSLIIDCYDEIKIEKNDTLKIITSEEFKCFDEYVNLDEVKLTISSDYDLIDTNADVVGGKEYTWNINKDDINKPIKLELKINNNNKNIFIPILIIILLIISTYIYFKKKQKND